LDKSARNNARKSTEQVNCESLHSGFAPPIVRESIQRVAFLTPLSFLK
jgi:hypothetical protein